MYRGQIRLPLHSGRFAGRNVDGTLTMQAVLPSRDNHPSRRIDNVNLDSHIGPLNAIVGNLGHH